MSALTSNYEAKRQDGIILTYPVKETTTIYKGALVCIGSDGYAFPGADGASRKFVGVCVEKADNSAGSNGSILVRVYTTGVFQYSKATAAVTDLNSVAYIHDDNTVGTSSTNSVAAGYIVGIVDSSTVKVAVDPTPWSDIVSEYES